MSILSQREGVNLLKVISAVATLQHSDQTIRQKDIVENTTLTKGAVSNNCKKLVDSDILKQEDNHYTLNQSQLLEHYRTHLEEYLRRRELPEEYQHYNDIRTETKKRMNDIFEGETAEFLEDLLLTTLRKANDDGHLTTLRDLFFRMDHLLGKAAESIYSKEDSTLQKDLMMLTVSMDRKPEFVLDLKDQNIDPDIGLKNTTVFKISEELKEEL